ncbi:uncharacterized protein AC631_03452 [Debaryomyces fabryi]|uniref:Aldehyde dehydrogenase domain-containing protein n=1 Tax=Debaryomyces fabryi TaxID=58627 RepID=A0A0V1PX93_9ASCO|nr:uncharacterized protein AC631_03452 [Debaryomyces fabryi]KSA00803.1 hypothetical protein AC631_03452 [Debaryomyces fabryi]
MSEQASIQESVKDGRALRIGYRLNQLSKLQELILENKSNIIDAIFSDISGTPDIGILENINIYTTLKVLKSEYDNLMKIYKTTVLPNKTCFDTWHEQTALIIGNSWEPLASTCIPLIYAISAGTPAVIKIPESKNVEKEIMKLLPRYLDSEYYIYSPKDGGVLLDQGFHKTITNRFPSDKQGVTNRADGVNVVALLDVKTSIENVLPGIISWKESGSGLTLCAPDIILVHELYLEKLVQYFESNSLLKIKVINLLDEFPTSNLPGVLHISACTTETAILSLQTNKINLFSYFGTEAFGNYILKFVPSIVCATINKISLTFYYDLDRECFQYSRYVCRNSRLRQENLKLKATNPINYEDIMVKPFTIKYHRNIGFFEQGFNLSLGIIFGTLVTTVGYATFYAIFKTT